MTNSIIGVDGALGSDENTWSSKEAPLMLALAVGGALLLIAAYRLIGARPRRDAHHRR